MIAVQLIAAGLAFTAAPANAEPREAPPAPASTSAQVKRPTRYCTDQVVTGSRIPRRTCHTRAEWMRLGYDPLAVQ